MKILLSNGLDRKCFDVFNILKNDYKSIIIGAFKSDLKKSKLIYNNVDFTCIGKKNIELINIIKLCNLFKNEKIIYVPINEEITLQILKFKKNKNLPSNFIFSLPKLHNYNLSRNKILLQNYCLENNILTPKKININEINKDNFKPFIIKPTIGSGSRGIVKFLNFEYFLQNKNKIKLININNYVLQEYIDNSKVEGAFAYFENGKIINFYSHKRIRTYPKSGGVTVLSEATYNSELKKITEIVCNKIKWNGLIMIEFIYDKENKSYYLIEINPRIWGSIILSKACNKNLIKNYIQFLNNEEVKINEFKKAYLIWLLPYELINYIRNPLLIYYHISKYSNTYFINISFSNFFRSLKFHLFVYFDTKKIFRFLKLKE